MSEMLGDAGQEVGLRLDAVSHVSHGDLLGHAGSQMGSWGPRRCFRGLQVRYTRPKVSPEVHLLPLGLRHQFTLCQFFLFFKSLFVLLPRRSTLSMYT